jgi:hypothetical protein
MNRNEVARTIRIWFQLLAQPDYVSTHRPGVGERFVAPDGIQDHVTRQGAIRILEKIGKQIVFGRREFNFRAIPGYRAAL